VKKLEAIVSPHELEVIRAAFLKAGISNMIVSEIREYGKDSKHIEIYRNEEYTVESQPRCKVETIVPQSLVSRAVAILSGSRHSDKGEKSSILVSTVNDVKVGGAK
jgi:nitrogen regulatory protein PII